MTDTDDDPKTMRELMNSDIVLTYSEAAKLLKISYRAIINLANDKEIERVYPASRSPRITTKSIQEFLDRSTGDTTKTVVV